MLQGVLLGHLIGCVCSVRGLLHSCLVVVILPRFGMLILFILFWSMLLLAASGGVLHVVDMLFVFV